VYEGFQYSEGNLLQGLKKGNGWFNSWNTNDTTMKIIPNTLQYTGIPTTPGALSLKPVESADILAYRSFTGNLGKVIGGEVWTSYLLRIEKMANGGMAMYPGTSPFLVFGKQWGAVWGIFTTHASSPILEDQSYLVVSKLTLGDGIDTMYMWVNPSLPEEPSISEADVVFAKVNSGTIGKITLYTQGYGMGEYIMDEIRVAESWEEMWGPIILNCECPGPLVIDSVVVTVFDTVQYVDTIFTEIVDSVFVTIEDTSYISVTDTLYIDFNTTDLNDNFVEISALVYPNPSNKTVIVSLLGDYNISDHLVSIVSSNGTGVYVSYIESNIISIPVSEIGPPGTYFLRIIDGDQQIVVIKALVIL
jgi:hypothetical protein